MRAARTCQAALRPLLRGDTGFDPGGQGSRRAVPARAVPKDSPRTCGLVASMPLCNRSCADHAQRSSRLLVLWMQSCRRGAAALTQNFRGYGRCVGSRFVIRIPVIARCARSGVSHRPSEIRISPLELQKRRPCQNDVLIYRLFEPLRS